MYARVSTYEGSVEDYDRGIDKVKSDLVPRVRSLPGSAGVLFMVDRSTGQSLSIALYDSQEALDNTREQAENVRSQAAEGIGSQVTRVVEYEVGIAEFS